MANISITIPDEYVQRVLEGMAGQLGYQPTIDGQPNPETRAQFCKRQVAVFVKNCVRSYEANIAAEAARLAAIADADTLEIG